MKRETEIELYPQDRRDMQTLVEILDELRQALTTRSDGVRMVIVRDDQFPLMNGKPLITEIQIEAWDVSA